MTPLGQRLARAMYALLLRLALPLYLARLWRRGAREPEYRRAWGERLGWYGARVAPGALWVHAVSLGETRAAAALVDALREREPGLRLLLTHGTATGRQAGRALLRDGDLQAWLPYDTPGAARRFLRHYRPRVGVLMETELWPALMREAERLGVPMVLANARLSERSARRGRRLAALLHPAARRLTLVLAQTADDGQRLLDAGAPQVRVDGNIKYDMAPAPSLLARGRRWREALGRDVVLAASTREGEEGPLLRAWLTLPLPRPLLLLVPRHPQRFDEAAALVAGAGLSMVRRSAWTGEPGSAAAQADVWLGDSMGEMPLYYACADVALLGGSYAPLGGQNLIEAAACGCPVVMGPHTFNFAHAASMALAAQAAIRVDDIDEGVRVAASLARDPERAAWSDRAQAYAAEHRGAALRMAEQVLALGRTTRVGNN
jgi:3-deoxy-D-manno-octulosonic-acid transferase